MGHLSPFIITFPTLESKGGLLSFGEYDQHIPFPIERIYWSYNIETAIERGNHYHPDSERVIIGMKGAIEIVLENSQGSKNTYRLTHPNQGLFIPKNYWISMRLDKDAVMLAIASTKYKEGESITDYSKFDALKNG